MKLAARRFQIDASGIRKVFDLAAKLKDPCNLSIGLPDFDVPDAMKDAAIAAIRAGKNRYTQTGGTAALRATLMDHYARRGQPVEDVIVTSGTSGALFLVFMALLDPGDEVMFADPYFVMYKQIAKMIGAVPRMIDTYPDFRLRREALEAAWTPRAKMLLVNSPSNPTGVVYSEEELRMAAQFAAERDLVLVSDEIYEDYVYDAPFLSPARFGAPERTVIISGLSKNVAMTGWRLGWLAGPKVLVQALNDMQQYSFVCAPSMAQEAAPAGLAFDMSAIRDEFRARRDLIADGLAALGIETTRPGGAFYIFPKSPQGTGEEFVLRAIDKGLLIVPGNVFSDRNSHFRISFANSREQLKRGLAILGDVLAGAR